MAIQYVRHYETYSEAVGAKMHMECDSLSSRYSIHYVVAREPPLVYLCVTLILFLFQVFVSNIYVLITDDE